MRLIAPQEYASKALDLSTKQFNASQRPFITVKDIILAGPLIDGQVFGFEILIKNTGRTPSIRTQLCKQIVFTAKKSLADVKTLPAMDKTGTPIDVGVDEERKFFVVSDTPLPTGDKDAIKKGGLTMYIHGIIRYQDSFGNIPLAALWILVRRGFSWTRFL